MRRAWTLWVALLAVALPAGCTGSRPEQSAPTSPVVERTSTPAESPEIAGLLFRPMRLPTVAAGAACPVGKVTKHSPVAREEDATGFGPGPLYPMTGGTLRLTHGRQGVDGLYENKVVWASTSSYDGPMVVRVGRLDGPGRGLVRLYYEASASRGDAVVFTLIGLSRNWPSGTFVSGPGCYAYQLDGLNLIDTLVFKVVP